MGTFVNSFAIVLLLISHQICIDSSPHTINTDREALFSFKSQITSEGEPDPLSTWRQHTSPCNWTHVSCDNNQARRVIGLDLSSLGLTGTISPYIGNLSFLRSLQLQNNQLTGELPRQLIRLTRLRTFNASHNSIGGFIPPNISRCQNLVILDLMQNMISGGIPAGITDLTRLQVLNLAGNRISGNLPSFLSNVSSLVDLNLGTNTLTGQIPSELGRLVNLKSLDLTINNLSGIVPPSIYNMSSLLFLGLASNSLGGDLPRNIGITLPNLLGFNFCINKFTGTIPSSLHNLTNLKSFRMARNLLHGSVPPGLENLRNLEIYNIGFNSIVNSGRGGGLDFLDLLINSTRLNFLAVDFNLFEGPIPSSIGNLSKSLTKLYMGGNDIHGTIPSSIAELRALELLNVSYSSLSGEIPPEIGLLKELRVLGLADNELSGGIPSRLGNLRLLTRIDISRNNLVGTIPDTLGNLQNLISMDLSGNMLNGSIPKEILISGLSAFLNLSQNHLSGPLPVEIGLLENVAVINISDNLLSGDIPASIRDCKSLEKLAFSRNMLSGTIPNTLESLRGLESLDLSSNRLSGSIPSGLQSLQSLKLLNLSFNSLDGEIPMAGVFADPIGVHLEGNRNLCSGRSCSKNRRNNGKKLTAVYVIGSVAVAISLCFAILFLYYVRRGNGRVKDSVESLTGQHQMVSYDELRAATDNFNEENLVGRGGFGSVYKGLVQGVDSAIKVLDTSLAKSRKTFLAECSALRLLRHRNLIKLTTVCSSIDSKKEEFLALVFEFMSNGSLDDWITGKRRLANGAGFDFLDRVKFAVGIASALDYLHNETDVPIVHCDLKPSNVLLDSDMTPKVGDFGLAKLMLEGDSQMSLSSSHALRGSIGYIPPEYGYGGKPATAGDVYSYGILLLELFTGRGPTHETFTGGLSVKSWVQMHFPTDTDQVLDFDLLQDSKIQRDCVISVLGVGLSCANESPDARLTIRDALHNLKDVERMLLRKHSDEKRC